MVEPEGCISFNVPMHFLVNVQDECIFDCVKQLRTLVKHFTKFRPNRPSPNNDTACVRAF